MLKTYFWRRLTSKSCHANVYLNLNDSLLQSQMTIIRRGVGVSSIGGCKTIEGRNEMWADET